MAELERLHGGRKDAPALIFIHGLGGHPKDSWRYDECQPDDFWLHWVGRDTGCDVWTLAYDAALSAWTEQAMPLPDQGSHIMDRLSTIHELQNKSLILVGHSMGGLVIKTMLTYGLHEDPRFKGLARRIQGIVFIATPHGGAQLASLFEAIKIVSRANPQVGDLSKHDHHLDSLNRRFLNSVSELGIKVRIFAEKRGVTSKRRWFRWFRGPSVLVVDRHSANPGVPDCLPINLPEDHFSICKPKDRNAQIHASVCAFVKTIAAAPVERPHVPPTDNVELQRYPGQLSGPGDNLLQPRDGRFYGRDDEVKQVLAFLRGTESASMVSTLVGGVGGAGKTEVCKAALKSWLAERSDARAFYVEVPDGAGLGVFIAQIGGAIGKPDCATPQELLAIIPPGLWYLDNLEGIADDKAARGLLGAMRNKDGVRLLASSRTMLNNIFGTPIKINQLPEGSALRLFRELWGGEGGQLPDDQALARFVIGKLGAHALSITLMARLGNSRSYAALVRDWEALGTDIVDDGLDADDRQGSLNVSLRLTANALASIPGALHLWTLVALFDDGVSESDLEKLETRGEWTRAARQRLADHNVLFQRDGRWHVLPPLARYALRAAQKDQDGFSWPLARKPAQDLFIEMAEQASAIKSNSANLHARGFIISHFSTVANLITHEINSQTRDNNWILQINRRLTNLYQFRIALSYPLLCKLVDAGLGEANMFQSLGDLERLLGQVDAARRRYDAALVLCRQEQDRLGEANTLRCLGDLEFRLGQVDAARQRYDAALVLFRQRYDAALVLYRQEQSGLGEANTLKSLGDLEFRLGQVDAARQRYDAALVLFRQEQDGLGEANTLKSLGDLEIRLGQVDAARQRYDAALVLFRQEQDGLGEANTLKSLGDLEIRLGQVDAARQRYDAALVLYRQEQFGLGEANTLKSLGDLEILLGQVDAARQRYDAALVLYRQEQSGLGEANTLQSLGVLEIRLGQVDAARQCYDAALVLFRQEQSGLGEANTLQSLGDLEIRLGQVDAARQRYDAALVLFRQEQSGLGEANTLQSLGDLEIRLGQVDAARQRYDAALVLYRQAQSGLGEANTLKSLGDLERRLGQVDAARQRYDAALVLFRQEQSGLGEANTLQSLGDLEIRLGQVDAARQRYDAALVLFRQAQDGLGEANTLKSLGDLESRLGQVDAARQRYDAALVLYRQEQSGLGEANTLQSLGDLESLLGQVDAARGYYRQAIALYRIEQDPMGLAYSLADLARCLSGPQEKAGRDAALAEAEGFARASNVASVVEYVLAAIQELRAG